MCSICGKEHPATVCWFREDDSTPADSPAAASQERRVNVKNSFIAALNKLKNKTDYFVISRFVLTEGCAEGAEPILSSFNNESVEDAEFICKPRGHTKIAEIEIGDHSKPSLLKACESTVCHNSHVPDQYIGSDTSILHNSLRPHNVTLTDEFTFIRLGSN